MRHWDPICDCAAVTPELTACRYAIRRWTVGFAVAKYGENKRLQRRRRRELAEMLGVCTSLPACAISHLGRFQSWDGLVTSPVYAPSTVAEHQRERSSEDPRGTAELGEVSRVRESSLGERSGAEGEDHTPPAASATLPRQITQQNRAAYSVSRLASVSTRGSLDSRGLNSTSGFWP